jgi:hypothetical protein
MKVDLSKMSDQKARELAVKLREAPCLICDAPSTGYRKLHTGQKVAFVPLCDECKAAAPVTTILAMMEFHNDEPIGNAKSLGNTWRNS